MLSLFCFNFLFSLFMLLFLDINIHNTKFYSNFIISSTHHLISIRMSSKNINKNS